jgi:ZIP family zinc transporter
MPDQLLLVVVISGVAAVASVVGGLLALWHRSSTMISSLAFGVASGALIGTVTLEMLPTALESGGLVVASIGFTVGMLSLFALDMVVHGGLMMGEHADQRRTVRRYRRRRGSGSPVLVLAGGTSAEELIEGLVIGVGAAVEPSLAFVAAIAIAIDNPGV